MRLDLSLKVRSANDYHVFLHNHGEVYEISRVSKKDYSLTEEIPKEEVTAILAIFKAKAPLRTTNSDSVNLIENDLYCYSYIELFKDDFISHKSKKLSVLTCEKLDGDIYRSRLFYTN